MSDLDVLTTMNDQLIRDEQHRFQPARDQIQERMSRWLETGEYAAVIFQVRGADAGYVLFRQEPDWAYLRQFLVMPDYRRQGVGRAAIAWLLKNRWQGASRIRLDVLVHNTAGIAFWKAIGFKDYCVTMELEQDLEQGPP